jgi:signal transduction protein with GAF and PtsI domain
VFTADEAASLRDGAARDVVALIREPGATYLRPFYGELAAVVCTAGTPRSHIGIMTREFDLPCVVSAVFPEGPPADGTEVEVDCSGDHAVIRTAG